MNAVCAAPPGRSTRATHVARCSVEEVASYGIGGAVDPRALYVYAADIDALDDRLSPYAAALSKTERDEALTIRIPLERKRMMAARSLARVLIARHLKARPDSVMLLRDRAGKPYVPPRDRAVVHFNASRSGALAVVAITGACSVGADVEVFEPKKFTPAVAGIVLSARERVLYEAASPERQAHWLARAWVCKEAVLKGIGCGLSWDPSSLHVMGEASVAVVGARDAGWRGVPAEERWGVCEWAWRSAFLAVAARRRTGATSGFPTLHIVELE